MGATSRQTYNSPTSKQKDRKPPTAERQSSVDWEHIDPPSSPDPSIPSPSPNLPTRDDEPRSPSPADVMMVEAPEEPMLPLESYVLDNPEDIPLSFLKTYPAILCKFPGPPCEALAQTISFIQALFTESPAFHPYITHMPSNNLPSDKVLRQRVVEVLERRLIITIQHLFAFFYGDINCVVNYIGQCHAALIPKPLFVVSDHKPEEPTPVSKGVEGFNNGVSGGAKLWSNPRPDFVWRKHQEKVALRQNLQKCELAIRRKEAAIASANIPPPPPVWNTLPPQPRFPPVQGPPPQFFSPPAPPQGPQIIPFGMNMQPQMQPPRPPPPVNNLLPRPPQVFHVPPPNPATQSPIHAQPTFAPVPPRFNPHPPPPQVQIPPASAPIQRNGMIQSSAAQGEPTVKLDFNNLDPKITAQIMELVRKHQGGK